MLKCIKTLLVLFFSLVVIYNHTHAQNPKADTLKIKGANDEVLSNYYSYFEDKNNDAGITEILQHLKQQQFINTTRGKHEFNSKYTHGTYWFALPVKNDTTYTLPLLWSFYQNNLGYVLYDITDTANPVYLDSTLSSWPLAKRKIKLRGSSFKIDLPAQIFKLFLVKVYILNSEGIYLPTDLTTTEDVYLWEIDNAFLMGTFMGYFTLICLFNIFLWLFLKAKIHLWHSLYVFMIIFYSLTENMYDVLYFPDWFYPTFNKLPKLFFLSLSLFFGMMVFQDFTKQKLRSPKYYTFFKYFKNAILILCILLFFCSFIFSGQSLILTSLRISTDAALYLSLIAMLTCLIYGIYKKDKLVVAYLIAIIFLLIAYLDLAFVDVFKFRLTYFRPGNILIGLAIEITLLTAFFIINIGTTQKRNLSMLKKKNNENLLLTKNIITIQEHERKRIAEDLHDDIGATLSALHLHISNIPAHILSTSPELQKFYGISLLLASKAAADVRGISHDLLPKDFAELGLFAILQNRIFELNTTNEISFTLITDGDEIKINNTFSVTIYRIINEIISNIIRHSQAQKALIQILINGADIQIIAEDNGIGINTRKTKNGIGMKNIYSRVEFLKGKLNIDSSIKGTTIIIVLPI